MICITALLTLWISTDFKKKWKEAESFHSIVSNASLSTRHLLIAPERLGVHTWNLGDSATYQLKTNTKSKQISFHVAAEAGNISPNQFWLRVKGLIPVNGVNIDLWRLLSVKTLRPGSESAEVLFATGAIPFTIQQRVPQYPVLLKLVGEERVETASGIFKCQHYFAQVQSPDESTVPLLELWANPSVSPLGIVRARWRDEVLELVQIEKKMLVDIPEMLSKTIESHSPQVAHITSGTKPERQNVKVAGAPSASVCSQCHDGNIGGKHLKLESLTKLSGVAFNLTQALYHTYTAKLARPHNRLALQLISPKGKPMGSEQMRFNWSKGSFWVETTSSGRLVLSLDEIAHQGNVRVATSKGRLTLNAYAEEL